MTDMKSFRGRYSPGCGGRISPRTLAADLEGELLEQIAFEGYAPPLRSTSTQAWARPPRPSKKAQGPRRVLSRLLERLRRWWAH